MLRYCRMCCRAPWRQQGSAHPGAGSCLGPALHLGECLQPGLHDPSRQPARDWQGHCWGLPERGMAVHQRHGQAAGSSSRSCEPRDSLRAGRCKGERTPRCRPSCHNMLVIHSMFPCHELRVEGAHEQAEGRKVPAAAVRQRTWMPVGGGDVIQPACVVWLALPQQACHASGMPAHAAQVAATCWYLQAGLERFKLGGRSMRLLPSCAVLATGSSSRMQAVLRPVVLSEHNLQLCAEAALACQGMATSLVVSCAADALASNRAADQGDFAFAFMATYLNLS